MMKFKTATTGRMSSWNAINILVVAVVMINYFSLYNHYWFVNMMGGYVFKLWLFPFSLLLFISMRIFITGQNIFIKKDNLYAVKVLGIIYFLLGLNTLIAHNQGLWYIGKYALLMFMPVVLFSIIIARFRDNYNIRCVVIALFIGGLLMAAYVEILYATGNLDFKSLSTNVGERGFSGEGLLYYASQFEEGVVRRGMPGVGINAYAVLLMPLIFVGMYLALDARGVMHYVYYICTGFLFYAITTTLSRTVLASVLIGMVVFLLYHRKIRLILILCIFVLFVVYWKWALIIRTLQLLIQLQLIPGSEFLIEHVNTQGDLDSHISSVTESIAAFLSHPIFGAGMDKMMEINEHNRYLEVLGTHGLFGFIPYVGFIAAIFIAARKRVRMEWRKKGSNWELGVSLYSGLVAFIIYLNAESSESYFFWIWFGLVCAWTRNCYYEDQRGKVRLYGADVISGSSDFEGREINS